MQTLSAPEIRDALLRDLANLQPAINLAQDSDWYLRVTSIASALSGLYDYQYWMARQIFPDTADHEYLLRHAALRNLTPHPATPAQGIVTLIGTPGAIVPAGLTLRRADGQAFNTTQAGQIGPAQATPSGPADGVLAVAASASAPGAEGNSPPGTPLTLSNPQPGLDNIALINAMEGGTAPESDAGLLARLLDLIRRPPSGGNVHDFRRWALETPGVTAAFVLPTRRGPGTVDVVLISGQGRPSDATIAAARAHIENQRPVALKNVLVVGPTIRAVDAHVAIQAASGTPAEWQPKIAQALANWLAPQLPGQPWIKSQAEAIITNLPGIIDRAITNPAGNIQPVVTDISLEWLRLGNVTVSAL